MKKFLFLAAAAAITLCSSCGNGTKATFEDDADTLAYEVGLVDAMQIRQLLIRAQADSAAFLKGFIDGFKSDTGKVQMSYYQGYMSGMQARSQEMAMLEAQVFPDDSTRTLRYSNYLAGLQNGMNNKTKLKVNNHEIGPQEALADVQTRLMAYQAKQLEKEYAPQKKAGEEYLAKKRTEAGMKNLEKGVFYKVLTQGSGEAVANDKMIVDFTYETRLSNDSVIESSAQRGGKPVSVPVNRAPVMPGLKQALQKMHVGDEWEVYIPASEAYGAQGSRGVVPPFSPIVAKVKLLATHAAPAAPATPAQPSAKPVQMPAKPIAVPDRQGAKK